MEKRDYDAAERGEKPRPGYLKNMQYKQAPMLFGLVTVQLVMVGACFKLFDTMYNRSEIGGCAVVSSSLAGLAQGLLQLFVYRKLDMTLLIKFYTWGMVSGIWTSFWTGRLSQFFDLAFIKIFWDQVIGTPMSLLWFFMFSTTWDGINAEEFYRRNFTRTLQASYTIWPLASTIAFTCLPSQFIVPFNAVVNLVWTIILGLIP